MEAVLSLKDFIFQTNFGWFGCAVNLIYVVTAIILTALVSGQRKDEKSQFTCDVGTKIASTPTSRKHVQAECFSQYDEKFNIPSFPLSSFVAVNFGVVMALCVVYSVLVTFIRQRLLHRRNQSESNQCNRPKTCRVFCVYLTFLSLRTFVAIIFIPLQLLWLGLTNFPKDFDCTYKKENLRENITCQNGKEPEITSSARAIWVINIIFGALLSLEIIYLVRKVCQEKKFMVDPDFHQNYFVNLNQSNGANEEDIPLQPTPPLLRTLLKYVNNVLVCCKDFEVNIARMSAGKNGGALSLDDIYVDLRITTMRENQTLKYLEKREEIYQQFIEHPPEGIVIDDVGKIFSSIPRDNDGKEPRTILVVGQPGIGKSMLSQKLMYDWAREYERCRDTLPAIITLQFKFRLFDSEALYNLKEFLSEGTHLDPDDPIHEYLLKNPSKLRVIFDGLDEIKVKETWKREADAAKDSEEASMSIFSLFYKLVKGTLLYGATILVTSRQTAEDIYSMITFERRVEIIGFTPEKVERYVNQFCQVRGLDERKCKAIWNRIHESPLLLSLCYVPANCFLVCLTLVKSIDEVNSSLGLPKTITLTDLYQRAVRFVIIERHPDYKDKVKKADCLQNKMSEPSISEALDELAPLAYKGMEERKLVFDSCDPECILTKDMIDSGLFGQLSARNERYQYCFLHLTIQEFLAAKYIFEEGLRFVKDFLVDNGGVGSWNVVIQFLFGLLKRKVQEFDYEILGICETVANFGEILMLFNCLYELQCDEIAEEIMKRPWQTYYYNVTSLNMPSIVYCLSLAPCEQHEILSKLTFTDGFLGASALGLLSEALTEEMKFVKELEIVRCKLNDAAVEPLCAAIETGECMLTRLNLKSNKITAVGAIKLFRALKFSQCRLTELDLSRRTFTDESVKKLYKENKGNNVTHEEVKELAKNLINEQVRLTALNLSRNVIGDDGLKELCNILTLRDNKLSFLTLYRTGVTHESVKELARALDNPECSLTVLDLGSNKIADAGVKELCGALIGGRCKLTKLELEQCGIGDEGAKKLFMALKNPVCKLELLDVSNNYITDDGVKDLSIAVENGEIKLSELNIHNNKLTDAGKELLRCSCKSENSQLVLNLVFNVSNHLFRFNFNR